MRLPPHVVRRRQGLYLRLRLPSDLARVSGRSHVFRTLNTSDPAQARGRAATLSAAMHDVWARVRQKMVGTFLGVQIDQICSADLAPLKRASKTRNAALADFEALSPSDKVALAEHLKALTAKLECELDTQKFSLEIHTLALDALRHGETRGIIEGLKQAVAAGGASPKPKAHADANKPWPLFLDKFFASRPGLSASTRISYDQAFREWKAIIGEKNLSDLEPRDVARYGEWLGQKSNSRSKDGILNRKTLVRLTGHICAFTAWMKTSGLLAVDPGQHIAVRQRTKAEKRADNEGSKRAFSQPELVKLFSSPLFVGCKSRHYRSRPGPNVYCDTVWWLFVTAHMTGGRLEELTQAPSDLIDLNGVLCVDLQHGTKTFTAPRLVPIIPNLVTLGFVAMAERQRKAGLKLLEGEGASADWSKLTNRYIDKILGDNEKISFHSFRHGFRQSCSAAQLGDYLCDKLLGHRSNKDRSEGSAYGKLISPDEARLVVEKLRSPIPLDGLIKAVRSQEVSGQSQAPCSARRRRLTG